MADPIYELQNQTVTLTRGQTRQATLSVYADAASTTAVDITGAEVILTVRQSLNGPALIVLNSSSGITNIGGGASNNEFTYTIPDTATFGWNPNVYFYDIVIQDIPNSGDTYYHIRNSKFVVQGSQYAANTTDTIPNGFIALNAALIDNASTLRLDGDKLKIDWLPTNYTRDNSIGEADDLEDLSAHLKGIDTALATAGGGGGGADGTDPWFNIRDYGALTVGEAGENTTTNRTALQAAADAAAAVGGGTVYVPEGIYDLALDPAVTSTDEACLFDDSGPNVHTRITVMGSGPGSVLRMEAGDYAGKGDWYMFKVDDGASQIVFKDITLDGNRTNLTNANEQTHILQITNGDEVVCQNVWFKSSFGDCIRLLGTGAGTADAAVTDSQLIKNVRVVNCQFSDWNRSGIVFQRACQRIIVQACTFLNTFVTGDQAIDFEPTGFGGDEGGPREIVIAGNSFWQDKSNPVTTITISGIAGERSQEGLVFANNTVQNGWVQGIGNEKYIFTGNYIYSSDDAQNRPCLDLPGDHFDAVISNNIFVNESTNTSIQLLRLANQNSKAPRRCKITGNLFHGDITHVTINNTEKLQYTNNVHYPFTEDTFATNGLGVSFAQTIATFPNSDPVVVGDFQCNDNYFENLAIAINISNGAASTTMGTGQICDNTIIDCTTGVRFQASTATAVISSGWQVMGNKYDNVTNEVLKTGAGTEPVYLLVGGDGHSPVYSVDGSPESVITAPVGAIARRTDGAVGGALYVKESGTGNTGWKLASRTLPSSTKTAAYTATIDDGLILCDATSGAFTVTLPAVSGNAGLELTIKKIDASVNAITVDGNASETIDDAATASLASQYNSVTVVCDGVEWWVK